MFGLPISCENQPELCAYQAQLFNTAVTSGLIQYDGSGNAFVIRNGMPVYVVPPVTVNETGGVKPIPSNIRPIIRVDPTTGTPLTTAQTPCGCTTKANGDCGCEDHSILDTLKDHPIAVGGTVLAVLYFVFGGGKE